MLLVKPQTKRFFFGCCPSTAGPGEFIYIPARTWHYVRGLTTSISLNFLF